MTLFLLELKMKTCVLERRDNDVSRRLNSWRMWKGDN
jgi:hypothetical protein